MLPTTTGLFSLEFVGREEKPSEYQETGPLLERNLGYGCGDVTWSPGLISLGIFKREWLREPGVCFSKVMVIFRARRQFLK